MSELAKAYEAKKYEADIYKLWEKSGFFDPDKLKAAKQPFSIVMPPPNTTGTLHLGHASALAYEDLMIRYKRLQGFRTLFVPGTDHAAIATQNKVEKIIAKEKTDRFKLGRDKFIKRVKEYVSETQGTIKSQIRSMGTSCDWSREAYTFDKVSSQVVNEVFKRMYDDGLIYRGNRIVNWCVRCGSTLADDEVKYVEKKTPFYYFKYGPVVIGTARPETKFQDKIIIVHPDDKRYKKLVGKEFDVPWIEGAVKGRVIADKIVDPKMGTGAMTITPAHSFEDFDLAKKYKLDVVQIINTDGKMTEAAGSMNGLPVLKAREKVVKKLKDKGLVDHIDNDYVHNLSVCYRCDTPVEPLVSRQWFVDVNKKIPKRGKSLKQLALEVVKSKDIEIIPDRFRKVYFHWMNNLHDWCISRQIWWGHRIPVWYGSGDKMVVASEKPGASYKQDEDTLDTWFSSATWTFSTLLDRNYKKYKSFDQWIKGSKDLNTFHPTGVLETGYDILFFWIARMILVTTYVVKDKPFDNVYLHGMVLDKQGRKMSKSLGNGIDPIEMIEKYGADALRLSLVIGSTPGQDVRLYDEKIAGYRNFVNKLWNIARFIFMTVDKVSIVSKKPTAKTAADTWILDKYEQTVKDVTRYIENWQYSLAGEILYAFTWNDLADWYVEVAKIQGQKSAALKKNTDSILLYVLQNLLVMWHPFTPFVTEVLSKEFGGQKPLMVAKWPEPKKVAGASKEAKQFKTLQEIITTIRNVRAEKKIKSSSKVKVVIKSKDNFGSYQGIVEKLGRCDVVEFLSKGEKIRGTGFTLTVGVEELKNDKKQAELKQYIKKLEAKLANKKFLERAPKEVVDKEKAKLKEAKEKL